MPRDNLEHLFEVMSERFDEPTDETQSSEKFIDLKFFNQKLFTTQECREVTEVEITLTLVKASLVFKGLDFSSIFADASQASGLAQQLTKELFCQKITELGAKRVSPEMIRRLGNYLALNQRDRGVIHLKLWLLHLRRVGTAF
jgi:hypothetical protein